MDNIKKFVHKWIWLLLVAFCLIGLAYPAVGLVALVCMLAPVIVAAGKGRMWCGNFCPRGSLNDNLIAKLSRKRKIPLLLKKRPFKILFMLVLMGAFALQLITAWGSWTEAGLVFIRMILLTTALAIVLGTVFRPRTWCVICPMGTMSYLVTRWIIQKNGGSNIRHVTFEQDKCVACNSCSRACPLEIDVFSHKIEGKVNDADCLKCGTCVSRCPKKSLYIA
jgi:polyferredoxin